jgi:hypothetical protein
MRAYGIPRCFDATEYCDKASGRHYARKSSAVRLPGKCGCARSHIKKPEVKRAIRRYWKRSQRMRDKAFCHAEAEKND